MHKYLFNFFRDYNVVTAFQSGFDPGDSTVNQLINIYNTFCKILDEGKEVRAIFCDMSKAFDRVWHEGLLFKLKSAGVSGSVLTWFSDYLTARKQRGVLPGANCSWTSVKAEVPQGSILGPLLFLLYTNDIVVDILSSIRLFADDSSLYIIVDDPIKATEHINMDLVKIHRWAGKCRKYNKQYHPPVLLNKTQIAEVNSHKHLGIIFLNDCTWHAHLELVKSKPWKRINAMCKQKVQLDRKAFQTIYFIFMRPF